MDAVYRQCVAHDVLLVFHCGSEPAYDGYACDPSALCSSAAVMRALDRFPEMKLCIPHFGAGETREYAALLDRYPNLYLDTAMGLAGYFPFGEAGEFVSRHWQRILYGTDFPNLPYAWDRDLRAVQAASLTDEARAAVLGGTARKLLKLSP